MTVLTVISTAERTRNFRLFWLSGAISRLGSHASGVALPILVLMAGGSPFVAGLLGTVGATIEVVVTPIAGVYADRYPRRNLMTGAAVLAAAAMVPIAVSVAQDAVYWPLLFGCVAVEGLATAVFAAAAAGSIRQILPEDAETALGSLQAREQGAQLVGPGLGGLLYQVGASIPFFFDALSYLVSAVCIRSIRSELRPAQPEAGPAPVSSVGAELAAGVRYLWGQPFLRFVALWSGGVNLVLGALYLEVILVARLRGASAGMIGLLLSAAGVAGLIGALLAPRVLRRVPVSMLVISVSWAAAVVVLLMVVTPSTWAAGLVLAAVCFLTPALSIVFQSKAILMTPDGLQGRVGTALGTLGEGTGAIAPVLAGFLVVTLDPRVIAALFAACLAVLACYAGLSMQKLRSGSSPAPVQER
ncbi:MAG: MFS transporter [Jatrophihabitantaceae bacterium]